MHPKAVFKNLTWDSFKDPRFIGLLVVIAIIDVRILWDFSGFLIGKTLPVAILVFMGLVVYMVMGRIFEGTKKKPLSWKTYEDKDKIWLYVISTIAIGIGVLIYFILDAGSSIVQLCGMIVADYFIFALVKLNFLDEKKKEKPAKKDAKKDKPTTTK